MPRAVIACPQLAEVVVVVTTAGIEGPAGEVGEGGKSAGLWLPLIKRRMAVCRIVVTES